MIPSDPQPDPPAPSSPSAPAPSGRTPLDEKLYLTFVGLGLAVIAAFFTITLVRSHRADQSKRQVPDRRLVDFTLTNRTGEIVRRSDLTNHWLVVNFVFTSCGISCLQVNQHMAEIQQRTRDRTNVRLVSLTVDPRTDTPTTLARFGDRFGADPARWLLLTGEKQTLYPLIETSFLGSAQELPLVGAPSGMIHSDQIALMDGTGRLRGLFDGQRRKVVEEVVTALDAALGPL